jgi:hypothetical protein
MIKSVGLLTRKEGVSHEEFGALFRLPELGPIGANGLANSRDFRTPVAAFEDSGEPCEVVAKFEGNLWATELDHSPLDVVAWHGNYTPFVYDLARFNTIGTVSFDHPDPSIFTVLTSPTDNPWHRQLRFRDLSAALAGRRAHLPAAVVSPQLHERVHGPRPRRVRRQGRGLSSGRHVAAQLHVRARARQRHLRARGDD